MPPQSRTAHATGYRRKPSSIPSKFQECNRMGCSNPVKVWLCTGSNYEHHRGHWYESCVNKSNPSATHFVTWRPDLPPHHVFDLVRHEVRGVLPTFSPSRLSRMSMHDILEQTTEAHPFVAFPPSPSRMLDRPNQGKSPTKRSPTSLDSLFDFSEAMHIEIPDHTFTEEEALQFSQNLDVAEEEQEMEGNVALGIQLLHNELTRHMSASGSNPITGHSSAIVNEPPSCDLSPADVTLPSSSLHFPALPTTEQTSHIPRTPTKSAAPSFTWRPGETETRLVNGSMRACCLGRGCSGKSGAPINSNCTNKLCKPCCRKYQDETQSSCKEASHKAQTKMSSPMYVHNRPLLPQHYQRREQAQVDHHERSTFLQNRQAYADNVRRNVYIRFWDNNGLSDILTTECKTYPFFCLADCSAAVREAVGATNGKMVKVFDPHVKNWVLQEGTNKQLLSEGEIVLIRTRGCQSGEGMKEAEEEEINRRNPRKRKFELDEEDTSHLHPKVTVPIPSALFSPIPLIPHPPSLSPAQTLLAPRELSHSPDLPDLSAITALSRSTTPTPAPKKAKKAKLQEPEVAKATIDLSGSSSQHGDWPWKSYQRMHDGFMKLEETGGKHTDIFPATSNKTRSLARAAWAAGSAGLKAEFRKNPNNTWKDFVKTVRAAHGGTIPTHTERKKVKKESGSSLSRVKHEAVDIELNAEELEVIVIEDD